MAVCRYVKFSTSARFNALMFNSPELAVGCCVEYKEALKDHDENPSGNFVLQVAFSFNAMVENDESFIDERLADDKDKGDYMSADTTMQYISTFFDTHPAFSPINIGSYHKKRIKYFIVFCSVRCVGIYLN